MLSTALKCLIALAILEIVQGRKVLHYDFDCRAGDVHAFRSPAKTSDYDQTVYEIRMCGFAIYPVPPGATGRLTVPTVRHVFKMQPVSETPPLYAIPSLPFTDAYGPIPSDWKWNSTTTRSQFVDFDRLLHEMEHRQHDQ
jgi:hypothetical protein